MPRQSTIELESSREIMVTVSCYGVVLQTTIMIPAGVYKDVSIIKNPLFGHSFNPEMEWIDLSVATKTNGLKPIIEEAIDKGMREGRMKVRPSVEIVHIGLPVGHVKKPSQHLRGWNETC